VPAVRLSLLCPALVVSGALAAPAAASGATFCVEDPAGCEGTSKSTIVEAVAAASSGDTIQLGHDNAETVVNSAKVLHLVGVGNPTFTGALNLGKSGSSLAGLTLRQTGTGASVAGDVTDVHVIATRTNGSSLSIASGPATAALTRVTVEQSPPSGCNSGAAVYSNAASLVARDVTIVTSCHAAISASGAINVDRSRLTVGAPDAPTDAIVSANGGGRLTNSIITLAPTAANLANGFYSAGGGGTTPMLVRSNLFVTSKAGQAGANSYGGDPGSVVAMTLTHNVLVGPGHLAHLDANGRTVSIADDLNLMPSPAQYGDTVHGARNIFTADPKFVNQAAGDYRPLWNSPLVDPPTSDNLGFAGETDLGGLYRAQNGKRDVGPFEYQRRAPKAFATVSNAHPTAGSFVELRGGGSDPDPGDTLTYRWDFANGGSFAGPKVLLPLPYAGIQTAVLTVTDPVGLVGQYTVTLNVGANPIPPAKPRCVVPKLLGLTLAKAKPKLAKANCRLGAVKKPKGHRPRRTKKRRHVTQTIHNQSPQKGGHLPNGTKVRVTLRWHLS
jgi:hypothetical protein